MGRKQNPLVAEFFDRGQRLGDASNRYEQTCRACHERFPKGRVDALTGHLLKRCPGLRPHERKRVIYELSTKPHEKSAINQAAQQMREETGDDIGIPLSPEALCSRKRKRGDPRAYKEQEQYESTFRLDIGGREDPAPDVPQQQPEPNKEERAERTAEEQLLHDLSRLAGAQQTQQDEPDQSDARDDPSADGSALTSDQLAFAAAVANEMVSPAPGLNHPTPDDQDTAIDPQLQPERKPARTNVRPLREKGVIFHHVRPGANPQAKQAPYMQDFHVETDKPRSKISSERNDAIQDVRNKGACVRCRMLKKPCSQELPCSTCRNIDTARRWRQPCTRARISDEFDLLRENVHMLLATNQVDFVNSLSSSDERMSGVVEATQLSGEPIPPATFSSVHGRLLSPFPQDTSSPFVGKLRQTQPGDYEYLEHDYGNVAENLALYLENAEQRYCERENSVLMRETLLMAKERLEHKPDTVLREAVSLWVTTYVLIDPTAVWQIQSVRQSDAAQLDTFEGLIGSTDLTPERDALSHRLITAQLLEFAEKRASDLCKSVMHEFEKRMVHRQRVQQLQFETFLTAVILLGCLEKLAWLYETWAVKSTDDPESGPSDEEDGQSFREHRPAIERGVWPTKRPPEDFVERADFVADIVAMLCRLRELPPPMKLDVEGYLIADLDIVPRRTSRYDASGYKGIAKKLQPRKDRSSAADKHPSEQMSSSNAAKEHDPDSLGTKDSDHQGQSDEHHAALVAQLHRDLQASSGTDQQADVERAGGQSTGPTSKTAEPSAPPAIGMLSTADANVDAAMANITEAPGIVDHTSEQLRQTSTVSAEDDARNPAEDQVPAENEEDDQGSSPNNAEDKRDDEDAASAEDPFMAHLRQAQAAARAAEDSSYLDSSFPPDAEDRQCDSERERDDGQPRAPRPVEVWFKRVKLKVADLFNARDNPPWDGKDCHCWELKYISRMLLPDTACPR